MNNINDDDSAVHTNSLGRVAVIGRGPHGVAMFDALLRRGVDVIIGVRTSTLSGPVVLIHPDSSVTRNLMENGNVQSRVVNLSLAIATADVLILSIPYKAQASFIAGNAQSLRKRGNEKLASSGRGLVLIDTSNGVEKYQETSIAERLQYSLVTNNINTDGETAIVSVVKAFNTLSAYAIGQGASLKRCSDTTPVCSDSEYAKDAAISIGNTVGLRPFNIGALVCARDMEYLGFSFFAKWGRSTVVTSALFCFFAVYCSIWYMVLDFPAFGYPAYDRSQPTIVVNKTLGNTALVLLAATYLPGKLAIFLQLYKRSARILFPSWLSSWLQIRKQLGLTAAFLVALHIIFTAFILTGAYGFLVPFGNANVEQPNRTMNLLNELVLMLGIAAFVALVPVLLSSLPSISEGMTWREWGCIQRTVGHTALLLSGLHAGCYFLSLYACIYPENSATSGATQATRCNYVVPLLSSYPAYLPPPASVSASLSITVCIFWAILAVPYGQRSTCAIRSGASGERRKCTTPDLSCVVNVNPQPMPTIQADRKSIS